MSGAIDYGGSWYAASMVAAPVRGPLTTETDVDVCVIGGGLAGLTVAREVARRGWSVALLEAGRIAWNASGRNLGFVLPGFAADFDALIERVGIEQAKELWALSAAGAEYVRRAIRDNHMTGVEYGAAGWLYVSKKDNDAELQAAARQLAEDFDTPVEFWPTARVRATLHSPLYFSAIHYRRAFTINPLNYALGLAAAAEAAGARLYEQTPMVELDPHGVRKRIVTPKGRLRARDVVLAGNVQIGTLMPKLERTVVTISPYVIVTAPLGERLREVVGFRGAISDTERGNNHYRIVGGDRLLWSGHSTVWQADPRSRVKALIADIARAYPQLGAVHADYAWTGTLGNTVHRMPQIGELSPGVWLAAGFGGHGLNTTAMAGELIAAAIAENDDRWRLFEAFELISSGGRIGRAATQLAMWSFAWRERLANRRALRREAKRPRPQETAVVPEAATVAADPAPPVPEPATPDSAALEQKAAPAPRKKRRRKRRKPEVVAAASVEPPAAEAAPVAEEPATEVTAPRDAP